MAKYLQHIFELALDELDDLNVKYDVDFGRVVILKNGCDVNLVKQSMSKYLRLIEEDGEKMVWA